LKTKKHRKTKISTDVLRGTSKWSANFQLKRSKVKDLKTTKTGVVYLRAVKQVQANLAQTTNQAYTIGRPNLLMAPEQNEYEMLGNWMDS